MTQSEQLLNALQVNYKKFLTYARKLSKDQQKAEDVLQSVALKLLKTDTSKWDILNTDSILYTMIWQINSYQGKKSNRYMLLALQDEESFNSYFDKVIQDATPCTYSVDIMDSLSLAVIKKAATTLPEKQKQAIMSALDGTKIIEEGGVYGTAKSHRRAGMLKIKEIVDRTLEEAKEAKAQLAQDRIDNDDERRVDIVEIVKRGNKKLLAAAFPTEYKKAKRNEEIMTLYKKRMVYLQIAQTLGLSRNTVIKVVNEYKKKEQEMLAKQELVK